MSFVWRTSVPKTFTVPPCASSRRFRQRSSVLFPEPDGPMMQTTSPSSTWNVISFKTSFEPNDFTM